MDEDVTQEGPASPPGSEPREPLRLLVEALEDVQIASGQMLGAAETRAYDDVQIAAHDAVSWWLVAKAAFQRLAIRAQLGTTAQQSARKHAKRALDTAYWALDDRLALVVTAITEPAVFAVLQQLKQTIALACDVLVPDEPTTMGSPVVPARASPAKRDPGGNARDGRPQSG